MTFYYPGSYNNLLYSRNTKEMAFKLSKDFAYPEKPQIFNLAQFQTKWEKLGGLPLSETQWEYVEEIYNVAIGKQSAVLKGAAGTGKTTVTVAAVTYMVSRGIQVQVSAPTHKAVKVLSEKLLPMAKKFGLNPLEPRTIHSVLGLKPKISLPGEPEGYVRDNRISLEGVNFLIVDECSMVGSELYRHIKEDVEDKGIGILFTGDSFQLKPVNEYRPSLSFCQDLQFSLKEVLRHQGPILELATKAKFFLDGKPPEVADNADSTSIVKTYSNVEKLMGSWLVRMSEGVKSKSKESVVLLCWTNEVRRMANDRARVCLFGENAPPYVIGDKLVAINTYEQGRQIVIPNNAEVSVLGFSIVEGHLPYKNSKTGYKCWKLLLEKDDGTQCEAFVLVDEERSRHSKHLTELGKEIRQGVETAQETVKIHKGTYKEKEAAREYNYARSRWSKEYFALRDAFADLDFAYAMTIHKSQGSTYDHVYVHNDYLQSSEVAQLMYVGLTRAAKEVHHVRITR